MLHLRFVYSYLNASIGWRFAAFRAGYSPKMMPIAEETIIDNSIEDNEMVHGKDSIFDRINEVPIPIIRPKKTSGNCYHNRFHQKLCDNGFSIFI